VFDVKKSGEEYDYFIVSPAPRATFRDSFQALGGSNDESYAEVLAAGLPPREMPAARQ